MRRIAKLQKSTRPPTRLIRKNQNSYTQAKQPVIQTTKLKPGLFEKNQDSYTQAKRPFIQTNKLKLSFLGNSLAQK